MDLNIKRILVPTDFSELSLGAINVAGAMAKRLDAELVVAHVMEGYEENSAINQVMSVPELLETGIKAKLNEIEATNTDFWGVRVHTKVSAGKIHKELQSIIQSENIDLVVMGTHGASGLGVIEEFILGSNAYRMVYSTSVPIITLRNPRDKFDIKNIVLPLDVTKDTKGKVDAAIGIAQAFGASIHAISVNSFLDEYTTNRSELEQQLKEIASRIKLAGVNVTTRIIKADSINQAIRDYAIQRKVKATRP
jgi:nucleotide-binding universal stress UspA family protein